MRANPKPAGAKRAWRAPERASKKFCKVPQLQQFRFTVIVTLERRRDIGFVGAGLREFSMQMGSKFRIAIQVDKRFQRLRIAHDLGGKKIGRLGSELAQKRLQAIPNALQDAAEGEWFLSAPLRSLVAFAIDGNAKMDAHLSEPADVFVNQGNFDARKTALE